MQFDLKEILKMLLSNKRINALFQELNIQEEELANVLPILITMSEEDQNKLQFDYVTSLVRNQNGSLVSVKELSELGIKHLFLQNVLLKNVYPINFEDDKVYERLQERKQVITAFSSFLESYLNNKPAKGLYIYGENHVGKTFTLKRFAKKIAESNKTVAILPVHSIVSTIRNNFNEKQEIVATMKSVDVLFLDDFGAETVLNWFRDEVLYDVLASRIAEQKPVFVSSNYSPEKLEEVEAKTSGEKYRDLDKAKKMVSLIKALTTPILLQGKKWN